MPGRGRRRARRSCSRVPPAVLIASTVLASVACQPKPAEPTSSAGGSFESPSARAPDSQSSSGPSSDAPAPTAPTPTATATAPRRVVLSPSLRVDVDRGEVEVDGIVSLDAGYLEQVACRRGTREHESLFVPDAMPSAIHAALLLAGFTPGRPGSWRWNERREVEFDAPSGDPVEVLLRIGDEAPRPVREFIRDARSGELFPAGPFVFAGSLERENPPSLGEGTHYLADWSGSVIGIVTFGDEVVAWREVIPDSADAAEPVWITRSSELPPPGTRATLVLRRPASGRAP